MDALVMVLAGLLGAGFGASLPLWQHSLYSELEFRHSPTRGPKRLLLLVFDAVAGGAALSLAFRPDGYHGLVAVMTAGFLLVLLTLTSTDFDRHRLPNAVTYPAAVAAIALCWAWPDRTVTEIAIGAGGAAIVAIGLAYMRFGGGDLKLVVLMGLLLGWRGLLPALLFGFLLGGLVAAVLLVRFGPRYTFAYGPYLAIGTAIVLLFPSIV